MTITSIHKIADYDRKWGLERECHCGSWKNGIISL